MRFLAQTLIWGAMLIVSIEALAVSLVAKSDGTEVLAGTGKGAAVVVTLKADQVVEASSREGMFWKVKADGKDGFVSILKVKPKPEGNTGLAGAVRDAVQSHRADDDSANGRTRSAVMGVRGLDESSDTAFAGSVRPNLRMVYNMEAYSVPQKNVDEIGSMVAQEIEQRMKQRP